MAQENLVQTMKFIERLSKYIHVVKHAIKIFTVF